MGASSIGDFTNVFAKARDDFDKTAAKAVKDTGNLAKGDVSGTASKPLQAQKDFARDETRKVDAERIRLEKESAAKLEGDRKLATSNAEAKRLARGRSRTLLTGGEGLEDDESLTISRRTLLGS